MGAISNSRTHRLRSVVLTRLQAWIRTPLAEALLLVLILLVGGYLRLSHINWDQGTHIHPDERFLTMVEDALQLPKSLGQYFDSTTSPLSPYNHQGFGFFVYGTLPIFIVRLAAEGLNRFNQLAGWWSEGHGVLVNFLGYGGVHFVGRALSGIFDLGCVGLAYVIGRRLYNGRVGLLAAALLAFSVLPLQQSHFFTVDTFATFFSLVAFYFAVRVAQGGEPHRREGGWGSYLALGAALGAAVTSRINLAPMAALAVIAAGIRAWDDYHALRARARESADTDAAFVPLLLQATLFRLAIMGIVTLVVFRVAQPYAFGGRTILDFSLNPKWLDNMRQIQALMSGSADYPPGHQWTSRTPFVFPLVNMVVWGMGLPFGLAAWGSWMAAAVALLRGRGRRHILPVAWIGGMFLWQGLQYVQSMRYLLPIYPLLAVMAGWGLWRLSQVRPSLPSFRAGRFSGMLARLAAWPWRAIGLSLTTLVVIATMLWGWGFLAIYRRPLSRITASRWMYQNIPADSMVANEQWDDPLPLGIDGKSGFRPYGPFNGLKSSPDGLVHWYDEDTPEKREQAVKWLNDADYIVLSSNRLYDSISRLPMRYPMTTEYYRKLFAEELGFKHVLHVTSFPTILGIQIPDNRAEEAFSVYDHPVVDIFQKTPAYSEALVRSVFDPIDLENTLQMWPKQVSKAPTGLLMTPDEAAAQRAGGTWWQLFNPGNLINQIPVLVWLLLVTMLGAAAFTLLFPLFRPFADRGLAFAQVAGILGLAWLSWIGPALKVLPFQRWEITLALLILLGLAGWSAKSHWSELRDFWKSRRRLILIEEGLFLALFLGFVAIRWANPDLWHPARGGEKPMEFAFLNAVVRSTSFPPYDPWFAGGFINYYYFGYVLVGTLVKFTGIVPAVAFNLAVPTFFALTGMGAFGVAYNLLHGDRGWSALAPATVAGEPVGPASEPDEALQIASDDALKTNAVAPEASNSPSGDSDAAPLAAGLLATLFVLLAGNLGEARLLFTQLAARVPDTFHSAIPGAAALVRAAVGVFAWVRSGFPAIAIPNDWWFWNATRIIPETINEFPFFTFVFADLHAHMLAMPLLLLVVGLAVAIVRLGAGGQDEPHIWRIAPSELGLLALAGFVIGALGATNTWDVPAAGLVVLLAVGVALIQRGQAVADAQGLDRRLAALVQFGLALGWRMFVVVAVAILSFYPYTSHYATAYSGLDRWQGEHTSLTDYLSVYGFFLAAVLAYLLSEIWEQAVEVEPGWLGAALPMGAATAVLLVLVAWALQTPAWLIAVPLFILSLVLMAGKGLPPVRRFLLLLIALGLAITLGIEVLRLQDDIGRMNTVFKFGLQAWLLLGTAAAVGSVHWYRRAHDWSPFARGAAGAVLAVLLACALLYPPLATRSKILDRFSGSNQPHTLDGTAYMDQATYYEGSRNLVLANDMAAIEWLERNVTGSPVILEGNTPGYRWGSRFSVYTGLPTVVGWDWHVRQQHSILPDLAIRRRLDHVREAYNTTAPGRTLEILGFYHVTYVIVGDLERAIYGPIGLSKFDDMAAQGFLRVVYDDQGVRIYQVVGAKT
jgi:YYY domain-containing protein